MSIFSRFLNVFRSEALERELHDEVRFHLEERTASNVQRGMTPDQAEAAALQQFGEVARVRKEMREVRVMNKSTVGAFTAGLAIGALAAMLTWHYASPMQPAQGQKFYRMGEEGISKPVLLHEVKPKYTAEAMHSRITGTVVMECIVQPHGNCEEVYVTQPLDPGLDREAINSLQAWRFQPGQRLGKPVPVLVTVDISFTLR